jgi:phytoene dehydrogenase-like protein
MAAAAPRVLVVGSGHNGLVAANVLADGGADVTVLEHAPHPGGATSSVEATLPGFVHDHCAGFVPMTLASPAMRALELAREGLRWVTPDVAMAHPFEDGTAIALHRDVAATAEDLDRCAPGAGRAWSALLERTGPYTEAALMSILTPLPPVRAPIRLVAGLRRDTLELARRLLGSVEATGLDIFDGERRPTAWLASSAMHSGLPPTAALSGAFGLLLQMLGHRFGWPYPEGGMGRLAQALQQRLERRGGRVRTSASVSELLVRRGRVAGVRLRSGEELAADAVLTTVSAQRLAELVPEGALPDRVMRRLRKWRYGTGVFKVDYALSEPVPWMAEQARRAGVVQVAGELRDLAVAAQEGNRGDVPERPSLIVGQHSLADPTRAPAGQHTLYVYSHIPSDPDLPDDEIAGRVEAQIERFAPGFGRTVLARATRSPRQTEEQNPSLVGGDLAGGTYEADQQLIFRPVPELCRYRTPLRGLYVAGASIHPGGAVHGISGRAAARALLQDRRLRRLRDVGG